jgi:hypothetical protein
MARPASTSEAWFDPAPVGPPVAVGDPPTRLSVEVVPERWEAEEAGDLEEEVDTGNSVQRGYGTTGGSDAEARSGPRQAPAGAPDPEASPVPTRLQPRPKVCPSVGGCNRVTKVDEGRRTSVGHSSMIGGCCTPGGALLGRRAGECPRRPTPGSPAKRQNPTLPLVRISERAKVADPSRRQKASPRT